MAIENVLDSDSFSKPIATIDRGHKKNKDRAFLSSHSSRDKEIRSLKDRKFMKFRNRLYSLYGTFAASFYCYIALVY